MKRKILSLLMALALLASLAPPALAEDTTAAAIRLTKTQGDVSVSKSSEKPLTLLDNMRLYNGYHVETSEKSYSWINLDNAKLIKEDAESEVEVRKDGKLLEVNLCSGKLFFDVAEELEEDETLNISTSTMAVGIRGTSGWVEITDRWVSRLYILEGTVFCSVTDPVTGQVKTELVGPGETVECVVYPQDRAGDKCDILRRKNFTVDDIPGFVLVELVRDVPLCDKIKAEAGLDILRDLAAVAGGDPSGKVPSGKTATPEVLGEAQKRLENDEAETKKLLDAIRAQEKKQDDYVSPSKALNPDETTQETPPAAWSAGNSGGNGGSGGTSTPATASGTMKLTDDEIQELLAGTTGLTVLPNTDDTDTTPLKNTVEVDSGLTVAAGKSLTLQSGIDTAVYAGQQLNVAGTLSASGSLNNAGTVTVSSRNTLRLTGDFVNTGTVTVTATGRVVVDGTFRSTGTLGLTVGAAVLAKTFDLTPPEGWTISETADSAGYYSLLAEGAEITEFTITFNAAGGTVSPASAQTGADGVLASLPTPTRDGYTFTGWFTAPTGGTQITAATVFTQDTTIYAQWTLASASGVQWEFIETTNTLHFYGTGAMQDSTNANSPPWEDYRLTTENVQIDAGVTHIGNRAFYNYSNLTSVSIPASVTSIGDWAFWYCSGLTDVTLPANVTSIGYEAFTGCSSLTSITIPNSVTSIGIGAFSSCTRLSSVSISSNVTRIQDSTFSTCTSLTSVTIPEGVTSIGIAAFENCSSLTSVTIPNSVTSIGDMAFRSCSNLQSVTIPANVTRIGSMMFSGCISLTSITIPNSVTSIGSSAFATCMSLTSVSIPASVTSIDNTAFKSCSSLTSITIPASVTSIGIETFSTCTSLTSVSIPASVTSIGSSAFENCTSLTNVYYAGTQAQWNAITIGSSNDYLTSATIHYGSTRAVNGVGLAASSLFASGGQSYADVPDGAWYERGVAFCKSKGLMQGTSDTTFEPGGTVTRAQLAAVLYRQAGSPEVGGSPFTDVSSGSWCGPAASWAQRQGIMSGYADGTFRPNEPITHQQLAAVFWRRAGSPLAATGSVPEGTAAYAEKAMLWAASRGMTAGLDEFAPEAPSTRAQLAVILMNRMVPTEIQISAMDIMCQPCGVAAMEDGSLLVTDGYNKVIWRVSEGKSSVYAGADTVEDLSGQPVGGYHDDSYPDSIFKDPWAAAPFLDGWAISDTENNVVRFLRPDGDGKLKRTDVTDLGLSFDHPTGLAADNQGNLYVSDTFRGEVKKITPSGKVTTLASGLSEPMGLCWKNGMVYVAESGGNRVLRIASNGKTETVAGSGRSGNEDGAAIRACLSGPKGVAVDEDGVVYIADTDNGRICRVQNGKLTTILSRDARDMTALFPVSPTGLLIQGNTLYICDTFARKLLALPLR